MCRPPATVCVLSAASPGRPGTGALARLRPMSEIPGRIEALRSAMRERGLTHYLVPSSDEHLNEYLPPWRLRRPWISGFTGSAGDVLVGLDGAWLFTDGRYHLQAEVELQATGVDLVKVGAPGHPTLAETLARLAPEAVAGFDPAVLSVGQAAALGRACAAAGATWKAVPGNLVDPLWTGRPAPPETPLLGVPLEDAGRSPAEKLAALREALQAAGAEALPLLRLDGIAWLLNRRSLEDIPFNPVFEAFAWIGPTDLHLFLHGPDRRLPPETRGDLPGLVLHDYGEWPAFLAGQGGVRVLLDASTATDGLRRALEEAGAVLVAGADPVEEAKALKNAAELEAMARANLRASAAKTRALAWLREQAAAGAAVTERSFQEHLEGLYRELEGFRGLSFQTISAAGAHGAIMHYGSADETPLRPGELFLIDSGVHCAGGTTDDTRTVRFGPPGPEAEEQRRAYTLVLRAHIACASAVFPDGAPGTALDVLCRGPMWRAGRDYDHGTGHGVGCFLNVHEGPFALSELARKPYAGHPLREGMVTSIEPGWYVPGWGGIRLENLYRIVLDHTDAGGRRWLAFEPLTFIPFEEELIDRSLLSPAEEAWLDAYQDRVRRELDGLVPAEVLETAAAS